MSFGNDLRAKVLDIVNKKGVCYIVFDYFGYNRTLEYLCRCEKADIVLWYDIFSSSKAIVMNKQLLYDGVHIRSLSFPLRSMSLEESVPNISFDVLRLHRRYIHAMYQHTPYFNLFEDALERLYISGSLNVRQFCLQFLQLCTSFVFIHSEYFCVSRIPGLMERLKCHGSGYGTFSSSKKVILADIVKGILTNIGDDVLPYVVLVMFVSNKGLYEYASRRPTGLEMIEAKICEWLDTITYSFSYPVYQQAQSQRGDFVPYLGVLDFIFNCGVNSKNILEGSLAYMNRKQKIHNCSICSYTI